MAARLPAAVRTEVAGSVRRLGSAVRSPADLVKAIPDELERLLATSVPVLARNPLPLVDPLRARAAAAGTAGAAAALQQAAELSVFESWGLSATAVTPAVLTALVTAWVVEVWLAVSVRVAALQRSGREVDEALLGTEIVEAALGPDASPQMRVATALARGGAKRMGRRWAAGLVPVVGVAYDGWDAQRTVARVAALSVGAHPPAPSGGRLSPPGS